MIKIKPLVELNAIAKSLNVLNYIAIVLQLGLDALQNVIALDVKIAQKVTLDEMQ
jgi:hypothetical protein